MGDEGYGMDQEVYQALIAEGWTPPRAVRARAAVDEQRQPPGRHAQIACSARRLAGTSQGRR